MPASSMKAILERVLGPPEDDQPEPGVAATAKPQRVLRHAGREPTRADERAGNGGPPLAETAIEEIARIATAMYGERWVPAIAKDTGEHVGQVRRWVAGTSQPPARAVDAVRRAAKRQIARLQRALGE